LNNNLYIYIYIHVKIKLAHKQYRVASDLDSDPAGSQLGPVNLDPRYVFLYVENNQ